MTARDRHEAKRERWQALPAGVQHRIMLQARENRRAADLTGPVVTVRATRCECGQWMRPGVDHYCPGGEA